MVSTGRVQLIANPNIPEEIRRYLHSVNLWMEPHKRFADLFSP